MPDRIVSLEDFIRQWIDPEFHASFEMKAEQPTQEPTVEEGPIPSTDYASEQEYFRSRDEEQRNYEREQTALDRQIDFEKFVIEHEFEMKCEALDFAILALGENSVHAGQPLELAKEIYAWFDEELN